MLRRHELAYRTMIGLSQQDIASFRDERLQSVAPSSAVRELAILSHVLEVAIRDWGCRFLIRAFTQPRRSYKSSGSPILADSAS
ncbi:DNA recombinase [Agrobacterium tumefaciens]|uniref:DNA recombinase n=1 Tax=Agrobacterium tumefaciens TaxID=358 RepID=A0A2L2LHT7_AGRTU|nr:DNA recombinase [Agrobacterium tumefaciens]